MESQKEPAPDALQTQLVELNNRSRWYGSQVWQVSFSFFAVSALAVSQTFVNKFNFGVVLIALGVFGFFVTGHIIYLRNGISRAILATQELEKELSLKPTALYRPHFYDPLAVAVLVFSVVGIVCGSVIFIGNK